MKQNKHQTHTRKMICNKYTRYMTRINKRTREVQSKLNNSNKEICK